MSRIYWIFVGLLFSSNAFATTIEAQIDKATDLVGKLYILALPFFLIPIIYAFQKGDPMAKKKVEDYFVGGAFFLGALVLSKIFMSI